jgi:hypothetical protein
MGGIRPCQPGSRLFLPSLPSQLRGIGGPLHEPQFISAWPSLRCGEEGTRTPDLLLAKQALYQLSYFPSPSGPALAMHSRHMCAYLDSNQGPQLYQSCALAN